MSYELKHVRAFAINASDTKEALKETKYLISLMTKNDTEPTFISLTVDHGEGDPQYILTVEDV